MRTCSLFVLERLRVCGLSIADDAPSLDDHGRSAVVSTPEGFRVVAVGVGDESALVRWSEPYPSERLAVLEAYFTVPPDERLSNLRPMPHKRNFGPGNPDPEDGFFYVSVRRDSDNATAAVLGPFGHHQDALEKVDAAKLVVIDRYPQSAWWSFGTIRVDPALRAAPLPLGKLNAEFGVPDNRPEPSRSSAMALAV